MKINKTNINYIYILILLLISIGVFLPNIASYPFLDTDETKFVTIAKDMLNCSDWINVKLNGDNLFSVQPLLFWIINISCVFFGKISTEAVRLPVSLISIFGVMALFFGFKRLLSSTYAFIISLIYISSLGILIFSRLATNDILSVVTAMTALLFSYLAIFEKKNSAIYWLFIYIFTALAFLSSGLLGLLIPFFSILAMHIFTGDFKQIIKPKNLIPGFIIFLFMVLPWNLIMLHKHGMLFIREFFDSYNFLKYNGVKELSEVCITLCLVFFPWLFSFLWILGSKFKDIFNSFISYFKENSQEKLKEKWKKLKVTDKCTSLNVIVFFIVLIFAILFGNKNTSVILLLIFPTSAIAGRYWYEYLIKKKHDKSIFVATIIPNLALIVCSLAGLFGHNILNKWIFDGFNNLVIPLVIIFFVIPVISIFAVLLKGRIAAFVCNIILMVSLSFIITPSIYNFIALTGGENDLITFAAQSNKDNVKLGAYISSKKYSVIYYYDKHVDFIPTDNINLLKNYITENPNAYVIVEIKDMWDIEKNEIEYMLLDSGKRYCLIKYEKKIPSVEQEEEASAEEIESGVIIY